MFENKNKILILIPYFGQFPWYFKFFLKSCSFNLSIDFLIFSDTLYLGEVPYNVKLIKFSLEDFNKLASEKLNLEINIKTAYKLCDFKPAYGIIFSDYVVGYDFWGQSDIDIIYGNIRSFFTDNFLNSYDFISVRHDYTSGCFALYRNNSLTNNLFSKSKDFKYVFTNENHFCFDECNFRHNELNDGYSIFEIYTEIESFTEVIKKAQLSGLIRAHFDFICIEGTPGKIKINEGQVIFKNRFEGILYHLIHLKVNTSEYFKKGKVPDTYYISKTKIYR